MNFRAFTVVALLWLACAKRVDVPPPPPPPTVAPLAVQAPVIDIEKPPEPQWMDADRYRAGFLKGASQYFRGRRSVVTQTSSVAPPHDVVTVQRVGRDRSFVVFTCGLGRKGRGARDLAEEHRHVELVAYAPTVGPGIGDVLAALGAALHGQVGASWKSYDTVSLPRAVRGLQHFDLLPGGEVDVAGGPRVGLFKVVPLSTDEFERAKVERGSQWVDSGSADPAGQERDRDRWSPALERDSIH